MYSDQQLQEIWERFGNTPINDDNCLEENFIVDEHVSFKKGDDVEDVWRWFDSMHSTGVYVLMGLNKQGGN